MKTHLATSLIIFVSTATLHADDWPQYRGPNRDDVSRETGLLKSWPKGGPRLLWTYKDAGIGYSSVAVVGHRLYTIGARGDSEYLIALDIEPGKEVKQAWATRVRPTFAWKGNRWSAGPSSTPTVSVDLIIALGGNGDLLCVETATGKERWRKNLPKDLDGQVNPIGGGPKNLGWGYTFSPLVDGEKVICIPGGPKGALAALERQTGNVIWRSKDIPDQAAYTSAMKTHIAGTSQYIALTNQHLFAVDINDGKLLWKHKRKYGTEVVNTPIVDSTLVYTTVGAGGSCDLIEVIKPGANFDVKPVYSNKILANHHGNVIRVGEHVYGASPGRGWVCQKFLTGDLIWEEKFKLGVGSVVFADGRLYCYTEQDGTVAMIEASPMGFRESGRFKIPQQSKLRQPLGQVWTPPVISGGRLFLRDQELLYCYDVKN